MATAPHVDGWNQQYGTWQLVPTTGGGVAVGLPLLPDELTGALFAVLVAWGGDPNDETGLSWVFTDITSDIEQTDDGMQAISISPMGRLNEFSQAPPSIANFTLKNPDGRYSAHNPLSPNWPNVVADVPIWIRVFVNGQWYTRFIGFVLGWPQTFDVTGIHSTVAVTATDVTDRLGRGLAPLRSPLYRAIAAETNKLAWWPLEDGADSTQAASGLMDDNALTVLNDLDFASASGIPGSAPGVTFSATSGFRATVKRAPTANQFQLDFHGLMPADPGVDTPLLSLYTSGTVVQWIVQINNGGLFYAVKGYDSTRTAVVNVSFGPLTLVGLWTHWSLSLKESAGTITWHLKHAPSNGGASGASTGTVAGTLGVPTTVGADASPGLDGFALVEVVVYDAYQYTQAGAPAFGYNGDLVTTRLARLCAEQGVAFTIIDNEAADRFMGPQQIDRFIDLLHAAEAVDAGFLYAGGVAPGFNPGLIYQARRNRYNSTAALTIDASAGDLVPPFSPTDDDFGRMNLVTVDRIDGSSATFERTDGPLGTATIGPIDSTLPSSLNIYDDDSLHDRAAWEAHKGTQVGFRYPSITLDLRRRPSLAASWAAVHPGSSVTITPPFTPVMPTAPIEAVMEGWAEIIAKHRWVATVNCSRNSGNRVLEGGSATNGRLQATASTLIGTVGPGDTSCQVATAAGDPLWSVAAADYVSPSFVFMDGVRVKVTNVTGGASPQTLTIDGATVTRTIPAGVPVTIDTGVIAL